MKTIIFTIFAICCFCATVNSFHIQSATYEDFPNKCSEEIDMKPFVRIGQKYYFIEASEKLSWFGAAHFCRTKDASLATIESADEMHAISQHLVALGYTTAHWFWLSGNDLTTEGKFEWLSTGKPMTYTKWSAGQPDNNGGHENCVHLWRHAAEFYMNDWQCHMKAHYICEANTPKTMSITIW